jgi:NAD(P)H-flavin reductase
VLAAYWAVITYMLRWESVVYDAYYWERIGYRAAWVSVTQVPFVYLLAMKSSIIGFLSGSSHERLNWLHRWVSRTLLITVTIHGGHFFTEWVISGNIGNESFVAFELNMMPMVKYGMGAWFILLWTFLSSLTPIRRLSYEIFVLQHLAAAAVFLWLLWVHVPAYATYNIWFAIATISFDKIFLFCWSSWENVRIRPIKETTEVKPKIIGHHAELRALDDETSEIIVKDVSFKWIPGQHVYLRLPTVGPIESHPFTIANVCKRKSASRGSDVQLVIQAQSGFTRRLHRKAQSAPEGSKLGLTAIITGPYGCPPNWNTFETLVLISASTGASFTLPILENILIDRENSCVSRIDVLVIVRRRCGIKIYLPRLKEAVSKAEEIGIVLKISIAVTGEDGADLAEFSSHENPGSARLEGCRCGVDNDSITSINSSQTGSIRKGEDGSSKPFVTKEKEVKSCCCGTGRDAITYACGRPDIADFIRQPVEASGGETSVAVCGGNSLVAVVRNLIARLSDGRAVHKGTGAQGIHLHAEHYCF